MNQRLRGFKKKFNFIIEFSTFIDLLILLTVNVLLYSLQYSREARRDLHPEEL